MSDRTKEASSERINRAHPHHLSEDILDGAPLGDAPPAAVAVKPAPEQAQLAKDKADVVVWLAERDACKLQLATLTKERDDALAESHRVRGHLRAAGHGHLLEQGTGGAQESHAKLVNASLTDADTHKLGASHGNK